MLITYHQNKNPRRLINIRATGWYVTVYYRWIYRKILFFVQDNISVVAPKKFLTLAATLIMVLIAACSTLMRIMTLLMLMLILAVD